VKITGRLVGFALLIGVALTEWLHAQSKLGTINFPSSATPAAQEAFIEGVKDLHNFQFDEAGEAFRRAQKTDPGFALAYWGEAMSYNHPLWAEVNVQVAKKALEKLAPNADERVAKAKTPKEKAYLDAVNRLFYTPGDKLARDRAYSTAMAKMYDEWPNDAEVNIFYALSLLGTVRPGDQGFKRQATAAAIAEKVFKENPDHPGAAHFIIHAFDDPDHAILALPAARAYAKIAPSADHALHMPTHIFLQLGMWQDVVASNTIAYKAAVDLNTRMHLPEGRGDFHTLSWLEYGNLMLGKFDEAKKNVELARQAADRNPDSARVRNGYLDMRARYILETNQWERIPLDDAPKTTSGQAEANRSTMPGMPGMSEPVGGNSTWTFIAGFSAAKLGDFANAQKARAQLAAMRSRAETTPSAYGSRLAAILEKELDAVIQLGQGRKDDAMRLAKEASDIELSLSAPSGPPDPMKPALELYGDLLTEVGRMTDAVAAYEAQLQRTPNRTPSVKGLASAKSKVSSSSASAK